MPQSRGQALLIVIISMAAMVTLVLSVVSRSVTDVTISSKEEEAVRSFTAAEAGLERTLLNLQPIPSSAPGTLNNATFTTSVTYTGQGQTRYLYPKELFAGESATIWFTSHSSTNALVCNATNPCFTGTRMQICWGYPGSAGNTATTPAIEMSVYYDPNADGNYANVGVIRLPVDSNATRLSQNGFNAAQSSCTIDGITFPFSYIMNFEPNGIPATSYGLPSGLLFAKVRLLYNTDQAHPLGVSVAGSGSTLPAQAVKVESNGISGESRRSVEAHRLFPEPPSVFDSVLYSRGGIVK